MPKRWIDPATQGFIYFLEATGVGRIKIGFTEVLPLTERMKGLQTGCPVPLVILGAIHGTYAKEKELHRRFAADRTHGEWFVATDELRAFIEAEAVDALMKESYRPTDLMVFDDGPSL